MTASEIVTHRTWRQSGNMGHGAYRQPSSLPGKGEFPAEVAQRGHARWIRLLSARQMSIQVFPLTTRNICRSNHTV
jgi:hypothetical protein